MTILPLATPRLTLRPIEEADRAGFIRFHHLSFDALARWSPSLTRDTDLDERFQRDLDRARGLEKGEHLKLVALDGEGELVAIANLNEIVRGVFQNAYAGWAVRGDQAGRGLATEAVRALLDVAFAPPPWGIGLHRVQANIIPENLASHRVAAKAGFREEGLAKGYLCIGGRWQDHAMYARIAEEHGYSFLDDGLWRG